MRRYVAGAGRERFYPRGVFPAGGIHGDSFQSRSPPSCMHLQGTELERGLVGFSWGGGGGGVQRGTLERRKVMSMPTPRACLKSCWRVTAGLLEAGRTLGYCLERRHHAVPVMSPHMCQSKPYV